MKVKDLLKTIEKCSEKYPDFMEWDIFTEQPSLMVPGEFRTIEEEKEFLKNENPKQVKQYIKELKESENIIKELKNAGWRILYDSEGGVYRDATHCVLHVNNKGLAIVNNY